MVTPEGPLAIVYAAESHVEAPLQLRRQGNRGPVGRVVAASRFLEAYFLHGAHSQILAIVPDRSSSATLECWGKTLFGSEVLPQRLQIISAGAFHQSFFPSPPSRIIHNPGPISLAQTWARATHCPHGYVISGVVHALSHSGTIQQLMQLASAPTMPYDVLICSNHAASATIQQLLKTVRVACGVSNPGPRVEVIPWGIDARRFRPATSEQQAIARQTLGIAPHEVVALSMGRLSFHARSNPFPLLHGLYHAARLANKTVRLLLIGWAGNDTVQRAWLDAARVYAPTVTITHQLGEDPELRKQAFQAANVYADFPDSLQQSHGLAILEAMACGLPVVSSEWAGVRDLVQQERTGLLVPTTMLAGSAEDALTRLLQGELNEDHFLAQTSQTVSVDPDETVRALTWVLSNTDQARSMGEAGRKRVADLFAWEHVIAAHDKLWAEQEDIRARYAAAPSSAPAGSLTCGHLFSRYARTILDETACVQTVAERETMLHRLCSVALTAYAGETRCTDLIVLRKVMDAAIEPVPMTELHGMFQGLGVSRARAIATLSWLLKYGLLRRVDVPDTRG